MRNALDDASVLPKLALSSQDTSITTDSLMLDHVLPKTDGVEHENLYDSEYFRKESSLLYDNHPYPHDNLVDQEDNTIFCKQEDATLTDSGRLTTPINSRHSSLLNLTNMCDRPSPNAVAQIHTNVVKNSLRINSKTMIDLNLNSNDSPSCLRFYRNYKEGEIKQDSRRSNYNYYQASPFTQGPNNAWKESTCDQYNYRHDAPTSPPFLSRQSQQGFHTDSARRSQCANKLFPEVHGRNGSPTSHDPYYDQNTSMLLCEDVTPLHSEDDIPTASSLSAYFIRTSPHQSNFCHNAENHEYESHDDINTKLSREGSVSQGESEVLKCAPWYGFRPQINSNHPANHHQINSSHPANNHPPNTSVKQQAESSVNSSSTYCASQSPLSSIPPTDFSHNYCVEIQPSSHNRSSLSIKRDQSFESDIESILLEEKEGIQTSCSEERNTREGVLLSTLLQPTDRMLVSEFTNAVVDQLEIASFCPRDRKGTRNTLSIGFPGFTCKHCQGTKSRTGGRYFPSSIKTMSDSKKTLFAISRHLSICKKCPPEVKSNIENLMGDHVASRKRNNRQGTQRAFFRNIWSFLHPNDHKGE